MQFAILLLKAARRKYIMCLVSSFLTPLIFGYMLFLTKRNHFMLPGVNEVKLHLHNMNSNFVLYSHKIKNIILE